MTATNNDEPDDEVFFDSNEMEAPEIDRALNDDDEHPQGAPKSPRKVIPEGVIQGEDIVLPPALSRIKALSVFGITRENLEAALSGKLNASPRKANHRANHIAFLREVAPDIIADNNGIVMYCARTILMEMQKRGGGLTADGRPIRGANCLGDVMGRHGLCLPNCVKNGVRYFMVSMVNATDEEKQANQALIDSMSVKEFRALNLL